MNRLRPEKKWSGDSYNRRKPKKRLPRGKMTVTVKKAQNSPKARKRNPMRNKKAKLTMERVRTKEMKKIKINGATQMKSKLVSVR